MAMSGLLPFLFPPPPSMFVSAMSVISFVSLGNAGISEVRRKHMQYSKFWNLNSQVSVDKQIKLSSKTGMLVAYTPAFLAGAASFWIFPQEGLRFSLISFALTLHFFKRIFEVLFVHKFSGSMILDSAIPITLSYFLSTAAMIYAQHLTQGLPEPPIDLKYPGIILFLIGISGNFYHHYLLSKLRGKGEKEYKIPKGGLFDLVICPHYLFEIIGFVGISFISQTLYAFSFTLGTIFYLTGRSAATRKWYLSKFEAFPKDVKALIPFLF
ncbi:3-oxo-5-alpha-steroid 4-dehydrogenase family protein [Quillaja saponaria]|uniref:3-oxo-5-alpha-steroid 4-dehydrogenase family protein n=1 Tax=Quillaja saponaria TaxID=32244 RepID=A0AAD7M8N1_QUISA|nr:3-oxo-5-alpha-steroid 4-dehydrogenase family protein [Quillaja saponaria]